MKFKIITALLILAVVIPITLRGSDKELIATIEDKYKNLKKSFTCKDISANETLNSLKEKSELILVDIREKEEQKVSILPGALTKEFFIKNYNKLKDKKIVVYCTIGYRSGKFAEKYPKLDILNLKGGVLAWSHAGGMFEKNGKPTKKVHVYSSDWNFLNSKYEAVVK